FSLSLLEQTFCRLGLLGEVSTTAKEDGDNRPYGDTKAQNYSPTRAIIGVSCFNILILTLIVRKLEGINDSCVLIKEKPGPKPRLLEKSCFFNLVRRRVAA
ncbi:MAG: hypothetical protein J4F48_08985, partial [Nitrospinae bacterium]|nr:hypothetical protein [Nitrospinota bacterium]